MEKIKELFDRLDNLTIRERGIVLLTSLALMYFLWNDLLMEPLSVREQRISTELQTKRAEQIVLNTEIQGVLKRGQEDPNAEDRRKLEQLRADLDALNKRVRSTTEHLVAPDRMAAVLRSMLNQTEGLSLLELKGLGARALVAAAKPAAKSKGAGTDTEAEDTEALPQVEVPGGALDNAYRHGLTIKFAGDYMSTLRYVRKLESLNWGFFWDSLEFQVGEYPEATASITVFTLSLDKNWIGV